jgi:hypothetical protein
MLNLYLVPRGRKASRPEEDAVTAALDYLTDAGIIGAAFGTDEYAPGQAVSALFPDTAEQHLLPAEMTFEALHVHRRHKPEFLPREQSPQRFDGACCGECGAPIDAEEFEASFTKLAFFPVDRVEYHCPACRSDVPFRDLDFGQPTNVARFWLRIEGAPFGRLSPRLLDKLGRRLGLPLMVVHEVVDVERQDWSPALRIARP